MNNISVNFNQEKGKIKEINGVNCAPYVGSLGPNQSKIDRMFKAAHIPYSRLHDCRGAAHLVDIHKIFPNFDADENDPNSYDFHHTDEYIGAIQKAGAEVYYRLGCTIEWGSRKEGSVMPKDFDKWTRICEHVIMHYNKGWANGFEFNIKYWEIWNEPENPGNSFGPSMWSGTKEDFFNLYRISSKYLKEKFPEISIGGYGSCGFYTISRPNAPANRKDFITYFIDFLEMVKKEKCPLDFFSWHIYSKDPEEVMVHARYVREKLDEYGFVNTEAHLNEWNYQDEGTVYKCKHTMDGGSFLTKAMTLMQRNRDIDKAMYYEMSSGAMYNGFCDHNDGSFSPAWYAYVAIGHVCYLGTDVLTEYDGDVHALASKNESESAILLTNHRCEDDKVTLNVEGIVGKKAVVIYNTDEKHMKEEYSFTVNNNLTFELSVPQNTVVLIKFI
jgi:hypothetical protein